MCIRDSKETEGEREKQRERERERKREREREREREKERERPKSKDTWWVSNNLVMPPPSFQRWCQELSGIASNTPRGHYCVQLEGGWFVVVTIRL